MGVFVRSTIFAAACLCMCSLSARADQFIYSGVISFYGASEADIGFFTTGPVSVVSAPDTTEVATGRPNFGTTAYSVLLDASSTGGGFYIYGYIYGEQGVIPVSSRSSGNFTLTQYMTPGTYIDWEPQFFGEVDTLTVTAVPTSPASVTPEPSGITLLGSGLIGVASILRKRFI